MRELAVFCAHTHAQSTAIMCSSGPLRVVTVLIGLFFLVSSLCGVGLSLYLLFADDPLGGEWTQGTYSPSAEDVGERERKKRKSGIWKSCIRIRQTHLGKGEKLSSCHIPGSLL